jgi:pumilio RNA-binding family
MTDVFGNYVIQKFFEYGSPEQKTTLVQKVSYKTQRLDRGGYGGKKLMKTERSQCLSYYTSIMLTLRSYFGGA